MDKKSCKNCSYKIGCKKSLFDMTPEEKKRATNCIDLCNWKSDEVKTDAEIIAEQKAEIDALTKCVRHLGDCTTCKVDNGEMCNNCEPGDVEKSNYIFDTDYL